MSTGLRIYSFSPPAAAPRKEAVPDLRRVADLGFNAVHWPQGPEGWVGKAEAAGLAAVAELSGHGHAPTQVAAALARGCRVLLCRSAQLIPAGVWRRALGEARAAYPDARFCAECLGRPLEEQWALEGAGFDYLVSSVAWWNGSDPWQPEQGPLFERVGASLGFPLDEDGLPEGERIRRYAFAALLSAGCLMPAGFERGIEERVGGINRLKSEVGAAHLEGPLTVGPNWILRGRGGSAGAVLWLENRGPDPVRVDLDAALGAVTGEWSEAVEALESGPATPLLPDIRLAAGEWRVIAISAGTERRESDPPSPRADAPPARIVIERIAPELDGGRYPVKRIQEDILEVSADIFRDGHDRIQAVLRLQERGDKDWRIIPFAPLGNDRWAARAVLGKLGTARFVIEAWTDHFGSWQEEVRKKRDAGQRLRLELLEGRALVAAAAERGTAPLDAAAKRRDAASTVQRLEAFLRRFDELADDEAGRAALFLSPLLARAVEQAADRSDRCQSPVREVIVDRPGARFAAWYEMFPRSQGAAAGRSATFEECAARLPEIRGMGFDVVYLVPIHPIGEVNRKGRNNHPQATPGEPGSPYAIGSRLGGHTAIEPGLGTLEDFRRFHQRVREQGMELALDFAVQCAPDHPWLKEHPGWFKRRPDGTIKYAENPPKKYEDIVNVDFDGPDWKSLWAALLAIVRFWMAEGVRIFRVDNPHTKPVAFWEWMLGEVRRTDPDVLFLAEAFTRPKMMRLLAKAGFSQSYTYFTWRNTKAELTEYLEELTRSEMAQYYRPNFFANTPDILPFFLQTGGRAAFRIRLVLAATLSGVYGIYNSFELAEAAALPGREEYRDSEKYEFKAWDWDRPGNIKDDIARLNRLRHQNPALQLFDNLRFHEASHGDVLFYSKMTPDRRNRILVAVTLDPHRPVRTDLVFPLAELGLAPGGFVTEELFSGWRQEWAGARHTIDLNPAAQPALVWRVT